MKNKIVATKHKTPKDKNETVSQPTSLYLKETDVTTETMNACTNKPEIPMIQTTFVKIGLFADKAASNNTNKTNSMIANGDGPLEDPSTLAAT